MCHRERVSRSDEAVVESCGVQSTGLTCSGVGRVLPSTENLLRRLLSDCRLSCRGQRLAFANARLRAWSVLSWVAGRIGTAGWLYAALTALPLTRSRPTYKA